MANTYLTRTSGSPTNSYKWTYSFWVKIGDLSTSDDTFLLDFNTDDNNRSNIGFNSSQQLVVYEKVSGSTSQLFTSNRLFRDRNAWYHIVVSCDRTLSTAGDRTKIYINGVQETSWASQTNPAQNTTGIINTAVNTLIGKYSQNTYYFNGCLSHVHFVDGTAYPASTFGSTDATTGEWTINTSPTITMGNNGFTILKDGNTITDQSSNSNNFTLGGGTLTNTEDCPDNVFCTMNPLDNYYTVNTFSNGNTTVTTPSVGYSGAIGSMGASSGKYYFEFKPISKTGDADEYVVGISAQSVHSVNQPHYKMSLGYMYTGVNGNKINNDSSSSYGNTFTAGDIIGVAMDLDNLKLYFSKNGTWQTSGDPTSGSTGTGAAFTLTSPTSDASLLAFSTGYYLPCCAFVANSAGATMSFNFGNGFFGTTAISSEGTNASGIGKFEYDVPAGYTALSTKGLNS
jgi:hypothetical protein